MTLGAELLALSENWVRLELVRPELLAPGIDPIVCEQQLHGAGVTAHPVLMEWFGWHNGSTATASNANAVCLQPTAFRFLSLEEALRVRPKNLVIAAELAAAEYQDPSLWYGASWVPIGWEVGGSELIFDTQTGHVMHAWTDDDPPAMRKGSRPLQVVVAAWNTFMEAHPDSAKRTARRESVAIPSPILEDGFLG